MKDCRGTKIFSILEDDRNKKKSETAAKMESRSSIIPAEEKHNTNLVIQAIDKAIKAGKSSCSATAPDEEEQLYRICHAIAKQYKAYSEMRIVMMCRWDVSSMREMKLHDLQNLYYYMRRFENRK